MGQSVTVESKQVDGFCVFTTDRVITGQDGERFESHEQAAAVSGFPALLALRLFESDSDIDHVYVASSDVIVRRRTAWDSSSIDGAAATISDLYRFYV
jgi:hypothetical protein